ncbi:hypothetical protein FOA52_010720 [Chlamydomonas sp. UWO 241]|nr:hypothetical protein FOA52_010720 [Chlamydomonas sp. UWO 241]
MVEELPVTFEILSDKNLAALKLLCNVIFPVKYQDDIYKQCMTFEDLTQLAYNDSTLVGAIGARLENTPGGGPRMYIAILGVLAPYRGSRIGSRLLQHCLDAVAEYDEVEEAYLHVHSANEEAVEFYRRFGFEVRETVENYYRRLDPPHAVVLAKRLVAPQPS